MIRPLTTIIIVALFYCQAFASGWNDYSRDIGHGFQISKMNSFQVCVGLANSGLLLVCPSFDKGEFGPVTGYFFTDKHLLVKTIGAKPAPDLVEMYTADLDQQYYFIIDKNIKNPYAYEPAGPLDSKQFFTHAAVPGKLDWESPTNPNILGPIMGALLILGLALLIHGWPLIFMILGVVIFFVIRRVYIIRKKKKLKNA